MVNRSWNCGRVVACTLGVTLAFAVAMGRTRASAADPETGGQAVTFNRDIAPIIFDKCMVCHREKEVAPFPLETYAQVRRRARQIAMVVRRKIMPPWKPVAGHGEFRFDRSLDPEQIQAFQDWVDAGRPEGEAKDMPERPTFPSGWHLGEPDMILELERPFPVPAEGRDIYVHFVFPTDSERDRYIRAVQVLPGNPRVAHHGVILLDTEGKAKELAAKGGGDHYLNFGEPGFVPRGFLPGFAPGMVTRPLDESDPAGIGLTLPKNADLVLQMHYHPTGKDETDQPKIGLYFTDKKPLRGPNIIGMANNDVDIAPGDAGFVRRDSFTIPVDFQVRDIWGHMHLLGRKLQVWADLPGGVRRDLLLINDWDFNWQDSYLYREPFVLPGGTVVTAEWTWDNSADNPRNPFSPPQRIQWGPDSTDEMSGLVIGGITVNPGLNEGVMWLSVLHHYLKIEHEANRARDRREASTSGASEDQRD